MTETSGDRPPAIEELDSLHIGPAPILDVLDAGRAVKRRRRTVLGSAIVAALLVGGVSVSNAWTSPGGQSQPPRPDVAGQTESGPPTATTTNGPSLASCAFSYPERLQDQQFAFDATVAAVDRNGSEVTLDVNRWFKGGSTAQIVLDLGDPNSMGSDPTSEYSPGYREGSRLLVSGQSQRGGGLLAWNCGYTRTWTQAEAQRWTETFGAEAELTVTVEPLDPAMDFYLSRGTARWDADKRTVTYLSRSGYSIFCSPEGDAELSDDGSVDLVLNEVRPPVNQVCFTDFTSVVVTIEGFTQRPSGIAVTEHGETRTATVYEADEESQDLSVTVEQIGADIDFAAVKGSARWDENSQVLTYVPSTIYDACMTEGHAASNGTTVLLTLTQPDNNAERLCAEIAVRVVVSTSGLSEPPAELTITEDGETRTVPVETVGRPDTDDPFKTLDCASNSRYSTDGGYMPHLQPDGFPTREKAVEAWLEASLYTGQDYKVSPDGGSALILRADGTAEASVTFHVHSGYTVRGVVGCSD